MDNNSLEQEVADTLGINSVQEAFIIKGIELFSNEIFDIFQEPIKKVLLLFEEHQLEIRDALKDKKTKRREYEHSSYKKHIIKLHNYISFKKRTLADNVRNNPELIAKWNNQRKIFLKKMKDFVNKYENTNRLPDEKVDEFYNEMRQAVSDFAKSLEQSVK